MQQKLSGIERELVLKYLQDANVPVTVTPLESLPEGGVHSATSAVFPVALSAGNMTVLNQGIIVLENPPQSVAAFSGKTVRVEFYFNRVGLCFVTQMKQISSGLALVIPAEINRISETPVQKTNSFTAEFSYTTENNKEIKILCSAAAGYRLFSKPVWSDIPVEEGQKAKSYLECFVSAAKYKQESGNGIHLIPVCRFLADTHTEFQAVQGRSENPEVLYVNHELIVLGVSSKKLPLETGIEFNLNLAFPVDLKPVAVKREVQTQCVVQSIYPDDSGKKECVVCEFISMKEEDVRFVYEMTTKNLFI